MEYFTPGVITSLLIMMYSYLIPYFIRKGWRAAGKNKEEK